MRLEGGAHLEEGGAERAPLVDDLLVRPELPLPLPRARVLIGRAFSRVVRIRFNDFNIYIGLYQFLD